MEAKEGISSSPVWISESMVPSEQNADRREVLRAGAKLLWVAPVLSTFFASQVYAANYSCYPAGHACPGQESCCTGLDCNSGTCGDPCVAGGGLCAVNSDCCSNDCQVGICQ